MKQIQELRLTVYFLKSGINDGKYTFKYADEVITGIHKILFSENSNYKTYYTQDSTDVISKQIKYNNNKINDLTSCYQALCLIEKELKTAKANNTNNITVLESKYNDKREEYINKLSETGGAYSFEEKHRINEKKQLKEKIAFYKLYKIAFTSLLFLLIYVIGKTEEWAKLEKRISMLLDDYLPGAEHYTAREVLIFIVGLLIIYIVEKPIDYMKRKLLTRYYINQLNKLDNILSETIYEEQDTFLTEDAQGVKPTLRKRQKQ